MEYFKKLDGTVFPSEERTIIVINDPIYGGAHDYEIAPCMGFHDGKTHYDFDPENPVRIHFIQKNDNGVVIPGIQSEQLALILLDRTAKLNSRFPSPQNEKMMKGLQMFLDACKERVQDRITRGVMGELKK